MNSLVELTKVWPVLDEYDKEILRDFMARWTHSFANFSATMSKEQKADLFVKLDEELNRRVTGLKKMYAAELSQSSPKSNSRDTAPTKDVLKAFGTLSSPAK